MKLNNNAKILCRIVAVVIAVLMVVCMMLPALYADVIFEPMDDFYHDHVQEMEYVDKSYSVPGVVDGYKSPENDDVVATAGPGDELYFSFVYTDENGEQWGVHEDWTSDTSAWYRLSELVPVYDYRDFAADHGAEFSHYADELKDLPLEGGDMPLWSYPGSEYTSGYVYLDEYFTPSDYADSVYVDPDGCTWVFIPYYHGGNGWVNADDPLNPDPVVFDLREPAETPAPTEEPAAEATTAPTAESLPTEAPEELLVDDAHTGGHRMGLGVALLIVLAIAAVGFVVVLSVVLIIVFYVVGKKKKKAQNQENP